jgi:hypothetical protein
MAKKRKQKTSQARGVPRRLAWAGMAVVIVGAIAFFAIRNNQTTEDGLAPGFGPGGVTFCQAVSNFALEMGYDESAIMSTNETLKGLFIYDRPAEADAPLTNVYQHPSWDDAGYLGTPVNDGFGNIYVAPAPRVNLYDNPPDQQNTIFKVDTDTGVMAEYIKLPAAAPPSAENPFGVVGLAYDCDTESLYAASIAGSDRDTEIGVIYHIDLKTGEIRSQLNNIDGFGLGVFNRALGKRLYFGLARTSEVWSVALDDEGRIKGRPRIEFSMVGWGPDGDDKARRIVFRKLDEMILRGSQFNFNLIAGSERRQTDYLIRYDPVQDLWFLVESSQ